MVSFAGRTGAGRGERDVARGASTGLEDFPPYFTLVFFAGLGISRPVESCANTKSDIITVTMAVAINNSRRRQKKMVPTPIIALCFQSKPIDRFNRLF